VTQHTRGFNPMLIPFDAVPTLFCPWIDRSIRHSLNSSSAQTTLLLRLCSDHSKILTEPVLLIALSA
jgi:hypothetical protein